MSEHNKEPGCGYTGHRSSPGSVVMVEKGRTIPDGGDVDVKSERIVMNNPLRRQHRFAQGCSYAREQSLSGLLRGRRRYFDAVLVRDRYEPPDIRRTLGR